MKKITKCPVCSASIPRTKWLKNYEQSARLHIIGVAKGEALKVYVGTEESAPHAEYVKKNVSFKRIVKLKLEI